MNNFVNLEFQRKIILEFISDQEAEAKAILEKALLAAEKAHQGQFREEGTEYIIHPLRAAIILLKELNISNPAILAAAILHDVVEDSEVSIEDIKASFGEEIGRLVQGMTRERSQEETEEEKKPAKIKKFRELLEADKNVRLIKCADILDNMRSWKLIPEKNPVRQKFPRWFEETEKYCIPIADKTNQYLASEMRNILSELNL